MDGATAPLDDAAAEPAELVDRAAPAAGPAGEPGQPLAQRARRALGWSFLNVIVGRAGTALTGIILARILVPEDYGVYAVALVGLHALLSVNELGVSLAVVRWPGDVRRIAPTVATLALAASALMWLGFFLAAPTISELMGTPEAAGVLRLLTVGVLVDGATAVPAAFITREFMQRQRLVVDTVGFTVTSGVSIGLAIAGYGAWSLAWGALAGSLINGVMVLRWAPWRYRLGFRRDLLRELLGFGMPLAGASVLMFAMLNVHYVVVGNVLGTTAVGLYLFAFNLAAWPVNAFSAPVRRVSMPAFARLHEESPVRAGEAFARSAVLLLLVTLPVCLLLGVFAVPLIQFIYGGKWVPAASALSALALLAVTRVLVELAYDYLVALGRARANLYIQAAWLTALLPALFAGAHLGGITGAALAQAIVAVGLVLPAYAWVLRGCAVPLWSIAVQLWRPAAGLALGTAAALAVLALIRPEFWQLAVGGTLVSLCYLALVYPMRHLAKTGEQAAHLEPVTVG